MEWVQNIQIALEFIEENLCNKSLSPAIISKKVNLSESHFSRAFYVLTGFTIAEYIRNRRLFTSGEVLQTTDKSVLNVALDFGYETPEAFSKAFKRFHGITPSEGKQSKLTEFYPLKVQLKLTQNKPLDCKLVKKSIFYLVGNEETVSEENSILLWDKCNTNGYVDRCYELNNFENLVGVYDNNGYTIKAKCSFYCEKSVVFIPAITWAVFQCNGDMPQAIDLTWNKIFSIWINENIDKVMPNIPLLEVYSGTDIGYRCEIWIPTVL